MASLAEVAGCCLLLSLAGCCLGEGCDVPPKDTILMKSLMECIKTNKGFCIVQCICVDTNIVSSDGQVNPEAMNKLLSDLPEGGIKGAMELVAKRCMKTDKKYNTNDKECMPFTPVGSCLAKIFDKRCPEFSANIKKHM